MKCPGDQGNAKSWLNGPYNSASSIIEGINMVKEGHECTGHAHETKHSQYRIC